MTRVAHVLRQPTARWRGARREGVTVAGAPEGSEADSPAGAVTGLRVEIRPGRLRPVVVASGRLDATGEPLLAAVVEHVAAGHGRPVAVDLRAVTFADTHGLMPVLRTGVVVVAASQVVRRLLALLGAPPVRGMPPAPGRCASRRDGERRRALR